jgi:hypothetical protein
MRESERKVRMKKALIIPVAIAILAVTALATVNAYRVPTLYFPVLEEADRPGVVRAVEYVVDGVRCRGTSMGFVRLAAASPGLVSVTTYARTRTAIVEYDPALTDPDRIREAFMAPVVRDGVTYQFFTSLSQRDID